jgi:hypothetical protein
MRYESIKKRAGQSVKIRPALQVYNDSGVLTATVEDAWQITNITENSVRIQSRDTQHFREIGLDYIHNYMEDPQSHQFGTAGILVLNVQLLLHKDELLAEPVAPPGNALKAFVRAEPRAKLLDAATRMRNEAALEKARHDFSWSTQGISAAHSAFAEFGPCFQAIDTDLRSAGQAIDMQIRTHPSVQFGFLLGVVGWWVQFGWRQLYANNLDDARLLITQWDGHPHFPGYMILGDPQPLNTEEYAFGLADLGQPRWLATYGDAALTTMELAEAILTKLLDNPRTRG